MANEENIRKVITMIKDEKNHFDMGTWWNSSEDVQYPKNVCGTPACIGGWAEAIMKYEKNIRDESYLREDEISEWLGISDDQGEELFYSSTGMLATRQEAIKHLEYIIANDEVNWSLFVSEDETND